MVCALCSDVCYISILGNGASLIFFALSSSTRNFVRVSSGPELGAYYHEFFLRDKPHLAAQMFCKNARTKIAMASSDPKPTALNNSSSSASVEVSAAKPQKIGNHIDSAQVLLMRQQLDPSIQLLLEQQLALCRQQISSRQQPSLNSTSSMLATLLQGQNTSATLAIQQQILAQKQQQERMMQLQQLTSLNLQRQKSQQKRNNFRASAA